jgi:hypothetical protein
MYTILSLSALCEAVKARVFEVLGFEKSERCDILFEWFSL